MIKQQLVFTFFYNPSYIGSHRCHVGDSLLIYVHSLHLQNLIALFKRFFKSIAKWQDAHLPRFQHLWREPIRVFISFFCFFFSYKSELQGQTIWTLSPNSYNKVGRGQVLSCLFHSAWLVLQRLSLSAGQKHPAGPRGLSLLVGIHQGLYRELLTYSITNGSNLVCDHTKTIPKKDFDPLLYSAVQSFQFLPKARISQDCLVVQIIERNKACQHFCQQLPVCNTSSDSR